MASRRNTNGLSLPGLAEAGPLGPFCYAVRSATSETETTGMVRYDAVRISASPPTGKEPRRAGRASGHLRIMVRICDFGTGALISSLAHHSVPTAPGS